MFCFFELLFISTRDKYEPTCINHQKYTEYSEKGIEIIEYISNDIDAFFEVLILDDTAACPEEFGFFTIRLPIYGGYEVSRQSNENKANDSIEYDILSFLELLFISTTPNDSEECVDHHGEKPESSQ